MGTTVVITQSNYLPWRGYFDLMRQADVVIMLDSVQFTRRDWRNRNIFKTSAGPRWLTVPVNVKGKYFQSIDETVVSDAGWATAHRQAIAGWYRQAAGYRTESPWIFEMLEDVASEPFLSKINRSTLRRICDRLDIGTPMRGCAELIDRDRLKEMQPTERLVALCCEAGATRYLTGPSARSYLDETLFADAGIEVSWMSYDGYPDYPQLWDGFEPFVSILDLFLNAGSDAPRYVRGCRESAFA